MSFENDIFISYAHLDDEEGWIAEFDRRLKIKVQEFLGRRLMVWRDPELQGNEEFAKTLVQRFQSVAALVSVLTPSYVNSKWCIKEMKGFLQAAKESGGKEVYDNKTRIFKVVKTRVGLERQPSEVAGLLGYEFYKTLSETKTAALGEVEFQQKLDDLAQDVALLLESIEGGAAGAPAGVQAEEAEKPVVYLAHSSFDGFFRFHYGPPSSV